MLFCEVSKVVGWKSQVVYSFMRFGLVLCTCYLLTVVAIVLTTLACFLWSVDVREY